MAHTIIIIAQANDFTSDMFLQTVLILELLALLTLRKTGREGSNKILCSFVQHP